MAPMIEECYLRKLYASQYTLDRLDLLKHDVKGLSPPFRAVYRYLNGDLGSPCGLLAYYHTRVTAGICETRIHGPQWWIQRGFA